MNQNTDLRSSSISKFYAVSNSIDEYLEKLKKNHLKVVSSIDDLEDIPILEVNIDGKIFYKINPKYVISHSCTSAPFRQNESIELQIVFPSLINCDLIEKNVECKKYNEKYEQKVF